MTEYTTLIISFISALGGLELVKYMFVRKANKRKATAEADTLDLNNRQDEAQRLDERLKGRDHKIDALYLEFREEQNKNINLTHENHKLQLKISLSEIKRCDVRGCVKRTPPSEY